MHAAVARAIVSTGLHHHNQYNSFCPADDLLEPLRPAVYLKVYELCKKLPDDPLLTTENKRTLLEILSVNRVINNQRLPLMTSLHYYYAASVREVMCNELRRVEIPAL